MKKFSSTSTAATTSAALLALGLSLAASAGCAQTRSKVLPLDAEPRSGQAVSSTVEALSLAVRADAAGLWQRDDNGSGLILRTEAVTWRDGAIGCPSPDRLYSQASVPGWRIVVADGKRFVTYHATQSGRWLLCPPDRAQTALPGDAVR